MSHWQNSIIQPLLHAKCYTFLANHHLFDPLALCLSLQLFDVAHIPSALLPYYIAPLLTYCFVFHHPTPPPLVIFHLWQALSIFNTVWLPVLDISSTWQNPQCLAPAMKSVLVFHWYIKARGFLSDMLHAAETSLWANAGHQSYTSKEVVTLREMFLRLRWFCEIFLTSLYEQSLLLSSKKVPLLPGLSFFTHCLVTL